MPNSLLKKTTKRMITGKRWMITGKRKLTKIERSVQRSSVLIPAEDIEEDSDEDIEEDSDIGEDIPNSAGGLTSTLLHS